MGDIETVTAERDEARAELARLRGPGRIGTHGVGCASWGPRHYDCAMLALADANGRLERLRAAAQAVVQRWDSPLWKDAEPTGHVINRLREAAET